MKDELDVFDFKNEDEQAEFEAGKFLEKFKNPNNDDSAVVKCKLLECGTFYCFLLLCLVAALAGENYLSMFILSVWLPRNPGKIYDVQFSRICCLLAWKSII